jgi:hypothetical protein
MWPERTPLYFCRLVRGDPLSFALPDRPPPALTFQLPIPHVRETFARLRALFPFQGDSHASAWTPALAATIALEAAAVIATAGSAAEARTEQTVDRRRRLPSRSYRTIGNDASPNWLPNQGFNQGISDCDAADHFLEFCFSDFSQRLPR